MDEGSRNIVDAPLRRSGVLLLQIQAGYYMVMGWWPLLHRRSFEALTGPKTDWWLVEMVGLLTIAIAALLLMVSRRGPPSMARAIAIAPAAAFALIDLGYGGTGVIAPIYMSDAVIQVAFIVLAAVLVKR